MKIVATKAHRLSEVRKWFSPISDAVFFGMCSDETPFMFSVDYTIRQSPNVIIWDSILGQGIRLIKTAVEYILRYKDQSRDRTEVVIISNNTREWDKLQQSDLGVGKNKECVAVVPFWHSLTDQIVISLNQWINHREAKNPLILFIDGFENVLEMKQETSKALASLMASGRKHNVYVVGTARIGSRESLIGWMDKFQEEIFGMESIEFFKTIDGLVFWTPETEI